MKNFYLKPAAIIFLLSFHLCTFSQKTYIVNNAPNSLADYHTLQTAVDSAASGSILLLQPSAVTYESISIRKKLAIYGSGYFLGQNAAPNTQANLISTKVQYIGFEKGSDGTMINGLQFTTTGNDVHVNFDTTSNITISRCYFDNVNCNWQGCVSRQFGFYASANILIQQCYIGIAGCGLTYFSSSPSGITFKNNIINGSNFGNVYGDNGSEDVFMDHNTIVVTASNFFIHGWSLTNNIIIKQSQAAWDSTVTFNSYNMPWQGANVASKNNVCNYSIFVSATNKILSHSTTTDSLFITYTNSQAISSTDGYFILKPNGAAAGYSTDNTDCGAFGGSTPYVLSGIPAIPNIYFMQINPNATQVGGLKLTIKAKANN